VVLVVLVVLVVRQMAVLEALAEMGVLFTK
jgi:hypothetical protein